MPSTRISRDDRRRPGSAGPWSWWPDEAELVHHTGQAFASLGVHDRALRLLERANEDCPHDRVSGRFIYLAHSLTEAVAAGAWSDVELILEQTMPYAQEVGSGRAAYVLRDTIDRLERATVKPHLRDAWMFSRPSREALTAPCRGARKLAASAARSIVPLRDAGPNS